MKKHLLLFPLALLIAIASGTTTQVIGQSPSNDNYLAASRMHYKNTAWNAVRDHLISGAGACRYGYFGQTISFPACSGGVRNAWANYVGHSSRYQSSLTGSDWKLTGNGVQLGTDFFRTSRFQLGTHFSYENSQGSNREDRIHGKDYSIGMYGVYVCDNGIDFRTVFSYGWQNFNSQRNNSVMAFDGNTMEVNLELGKRHYACGWSSRPSFALDWSKSILHGGQEAGGITYDKIDHSQLLFRFGTDLRYDWGPLMFDSGLYYSYDMLGNELRSGTTSGTLVGSTLGRSMISYNLGGSWIVNSKLTIFGGYRGEYAPESAGKGCVNIGYVGGALRW